MIVIHSNTFTAEEEFNIRYIATQIYTYMPFLTVLPPEMSPEFPSMTKLRLLVLKVNILHPTSMHTYIHACISSP
jgi:hypothetical protein